MRSLALCVLCQGGSLQDVYQRRDHVRRLLEAGVDVCTVVVEEVCKRTRRPLLHGVVGILQHLCERLERPGLDDPLLDLGVRREVHDERRGTAAHIYVRIVEQSHGLSGDLRFVDVDLPLCAAAGEVGQGAKGLGGAHVLAEQGGKGRDRALVGRSFCHLRVAPDEVHQCACGVLPRKVRAFLHEVDEGPDGTIPDDLLRVVRAVAGKVQQGAGSLAADLRLVRRRQQRAEPRDRVRTHDGAASLLTGHRHVHEGTCRILLRDVGRALQQFCELGYGAAFDDHGAGLLVPDGEVPNGVGRLLCCVDRTGERRHEGLDDSRLCHDLLVPRALVAEIPQDCRSGLLDIRVAVGEDPQQEPHSPLLEKLRGHLLGLLPHARVRQQQHHLQRHLKLRLVAEHLHERDGHALRDHLHAEFLVALDVLV
mmetsp:Transcript_94550/g.282344  ORF Transcript_94550/g.282344 Transcript_94550/m.282344 type:complete len:423 (-) Transcript_94550:730-1998(-)